MSLHHKLCHVLGGAFGLPHAETHTVILPHAVAYNASAAPVALDRVARALGAHEAAGALFDLAAEHGAPTSLRQIGMSESDLDKATEVALQSALLEPASDREESDPGASRRCLSRPPAVSNRSATVVRNTSEPTMEVFPELTQDVIYRMAHAESARLREVMAIVVRHLHAIVRETNLTQGEWSQAIDFLTRAGQICSESRQEFILLVGHSRRVDAGRCGR